MVTAWEDWLRWRAEQKYTSLPLLRELSVQLDSNGRVPCWTEMWQDASPYAFILESGKDGRFTYLGIRPEAMISGKGLQAESVLFQLTDQQAQAPKRWRGKPLDIVRDWMGGSKGPRLPQGPKWLGGCIGFWSYDIVRTIERLPELADDDTGLPDYMFFRMNELWIVDHERSVVYCAVHCPIEVEMPEEDLRLLYDRAVSRTEGMADYWLTWFENEQARARAERRQGEMRRAMEQDSLHIDVEGLSGVTSPTSKQMYMDAVEKIQQYIGQGDVFQVNLSQRQSREIASAAEELYEWLRIVNPSPYMGLLRCPDFQLVSGSPELLVEQAGRRLITRPIAGTRRRGRTEEEEARFVEELLMNEKERAEHIMLVDLERNDLGRISEYGTVRVKELMVVERYSHVMHLVSQVEGELARGKDAYDVIAATFPGGTITGAPKIRTMEIIEELEPVRRGPYTGSLGWIDYSGDMEFNIIIRTMAIKDGKAYIQAGAGIVIDSDPEREYYESLSKAKALWKAVQYSESTKEGGSGV